MTGKSSGKMNNRFSDKKGIIRMVVFVVIVALILFAMLFAGRKNDGAVTAYVKMGTITEKQATTAYFAREQVTVTTEFSGKLVPQAAEGTRVAKGEIIAYVVSDGMEEVFSKMKNTERKLNSAQKAIYSYTEESSDPYSMTEKSVAEIAQKITNAVNGNNIEQYSEFFSEIDDQLKNSVGESEDITSAYVDNLKKELDAYREELKGFYHEIKAESSGIVSFYVSDEDERINELYRQLAECEENGKYDGISVKDFTDLGTTKSYSGKNVTEGTSVARINTGIYCYVLADAKIDFYGKCEFTSQSLGIKAKGNVLYTDTNLVIMKCSTGNESFSEYNSGKVNIYVSSESGMKVPVSALTDWDTPKVNARLTVIKSGLVKYIYVEILAYDEEYAIIASHAVFDENVSNVKINDTYVVNYESVYEGQPIG